MGCKSQKENCPKAVDFESQKDGPAQATHKLAWVQWLELSEALGLGKASGRAEYSGSWLLLVLALGGRVEVIQHTLDVLKGGSLLRAVLPTAHHDVVELLRAVLGARHPVATLQGSNHLGVGHT